MSTKPESPWELAGKLLPSRRSFLKTSSLTAAGLAVSAVAGHGRAVHARGFREARARRQEAPTRVGEVALRARRTHGLSRRGPGEDRHAHRRHLRRPALPGRRRQALALGHLQPAHRHRRRALRQAAEARVAARAGLRAARHRRRDDPGMRRSTAPTGATSPSAASIRSATSSTATRTAPVSVRWRPSRRSSR